MNKVLVPFTDPDSAERALRRLLEESPGGPFEVELLAIAEPPNLTNVRRFVSPQRAEASGACGRGVLDREARTSVAGGQRSLSRACRSR